MLLKHKGLDKTRAITIAKTLMTIVDENTNFKYLKKSQFEYLVLTYYNLFNIIEENNYKCVLDFGCGIGTSKMVYDYFDWSFDFYCSDIYHDSSENDENYTFNLFLEKLAIIPFRTTNILSDDFKFLEIPPKKFDCILTVRFPPLSKLLITPPEFKSKLSPYCYSEFDLIYHNISPEWNPIHQMYIYENDYNPKEKYINDKFGILKW